MMRRHHIYIVLLVLEAFMLTGLTGCIQELEDIRVESDCITFSPYMMVETKSSSNNNYTDGYLSVESEDWKSDATQTKASPVLLLKGDANVTAYQYNGEWNATNKSWASLTNSKFSFDGNVMTAEDKVMWGAVTGKKMRVYAYAPYSTLATNDGQITGVPALAFSPDTDVTKQVDLIGTVADVSVEESKGKSIALGFKHTLTGIKFKAGFACKIESVKISGVYGSGTYSIGGDWTLSNATQDYKISFSSGKDVSAGGAITSDEQTLMLIPQTLPAGAKVTLVYQEGGTTKTITASLEGRKWEAGKMITYTLNKEVEGSNYVYFDLAAGNVSIGATYSGKIYVNGEAKDVSGDHKSSNVYYVYQSSDLKEEKFKAFTPAQTGYSNEDDYTKRANCRIPDYKGVTCNGKSWAEYITNNQSVEDVIEMWDDGKNVRSNGTDAKTERNIGKAVVREVGRTHTLNHIYVAGKNSTYNLVIDDIYTTWQEHIKDKLRGRSKGGISYDAKGGASLKITLVGDNRLGYVDIKNTETDEIVFEGTGSLTAANADFIMPIDLYNAEGINLKWDYSYYGTTESEQGYISNHRKSAIGNDTRSSGAVYNLIFNSGTIFAGTTKVENCSAIGGGGNGYGEVYINGGSITAVATTTGTAIGGGIGFTDVGGKGDVHITGGNVYAYNFANRWEVPSSAIGGGGSKGNVGKEGYINISGGYVYAFSALGTAIGGGSSKALVGGDATINISGGEIIARSATGAGIGGGSSCTGGGNTSYDGGTAKIHILGSPVIRTGSIGGGTTGAKNGRIGSANITIEGGDIQAQFVMAAGAKATPSFTMRGGTIRDSYATDNSEYIHLQTKGGAVYLEDGKFEMTGGTIRDCSAEYGGAVYIKKGEESENPPSFVMSGGQIYQCTSSNDGGAVYLEDGTVTISGIKTEIGSCQSHGNGGAICVKKTGEVNPSFSMSGGSLNKNYADFNGGALHLEGGQVTVSGGQIYGNAALNGNGGGININSGSFDMPAGGTALINANSALLQTQQTDSSEGNGGGVYVTSEGSEVSVNLLSGKIIGNSSTNTGGGIGVDVSKSETKATVIVGTDEAGPEVTGNVTLMRGAGLYVNGEQASIVINAGAIKNNSTVGYVDNPDVMNDGGMVTLNGGDVKSVNVIYKANGGDSISGEQEGEKEYIQRIVTDTNNKLVAPTFYRNGYKFVRWNTREDGLGVDNYEDGQIVKRSTDLTLYAIWELEKQ